MILSNTKKSFRNGLIPALITYLAIGFILLPYYLYQLDPDGISYISIAQKYAIGNFQDAINGFWGPLYSWLLTPLILLRIEPLLASKMLNFSIGLLAFPTMHTLCHIFALSNTTRKVILFALVPIVLSFSLCSVMPDLLMVVILLTYFCIIFQPGYGSSAKNGMLCGLCGAMAYFAKSYGLPFFLSHFSVMNFLHFLRSENQKQKSTTLRGFFGGLLVFGIVSAPWIMLISKKYQKLTFSTAGAYNFAYFSPESKGRHPKLYKGFYSPSNPTAIAVTEDRFWPEIEPWPYIEPWSPFDSLDNFKYHLRHNVRANANHIIRLFKSFSTFSVVICAAYVLLLCRSPREILRQHQLLYPFLSLVLYSLGYVFVLIQERYVWITCLLLLLMGGYLINQLAESKLFTRMGRVALYGIFVASFIYSPPIKLKLIPNINSGKSIYFTSKSLANHIHRGDNIASNKEYRNSYYLAYHLDARYYGIPRENVSKQELEVELDKFNVQYYLVWEESLEKNLPLSKFRKVKVEGIEEPRLYTLRANE